MIYLKNINKKYKKKIIFDHVNLKIENPGIYLLRGENGCGKTTLLNIIGGYTSFKGRVINHFKKSISYTFQNNYLIEFLTIEEHLKLFNVDSSILHKYKLEDKLNFYPAALSLGQRQRIAIILSVCSDNNLILLDEPFANLDKENSKLFFCLIKKYSKKKIIILVDHTGRFANEYNGIIEIKNKKVFFNKKEDETNFVFEKSKNKKNLVRSKKSSSINFKEHMKLYVLSLLCFLLFFSLSVAKKFFGETINKDISVSVDYNKYYLKTCRDVLYSEFRVSKCTNPSDESLRNLEREELKYGLNYDFFLNYIYQRKDLSTVYNEDIELKQGHYPLNEHQVITNNQYQLGDTIELNGEFLFNGMKIDFYAESLTVEVVGIYEETYFFKDSNIYFDYDAIDVFFNNEILANNHLSMYEAFSGMEIENYKYISFGKIDNENISFDGVKEELYTQIQELYSRITKIIEYLKIIIAAFLFIFLYRVIKLNFVKKQRSHAFLIANSWSKHKLIFSESMHLLIFNFMVFGVLGIIYYLITQQISFIIDLLLIINLLDMLCLVVGYKFLNEKKVSRLIGEERW